jgi:hypothetical protein
MPHHGWIAFSYSWRCLKHAGRNSCGSLFPFDHSSLSSSFFTGAQPRHDGPPKSFILDVDLRSASHRVSKLHSLAIFEVGIGVIEEFWSHDSSSTLWPSMLSIIILFCTRLCHLDLPSTTPPNHPPSRSDEKKKGRLSILLCSLPNQSPSLFNLHLLTSTISCVSCALPLSP